MPIPRQMLQVKVFSYFRYLGVEISGKATDYITLNLPPVVQEVRQKLKAWESLPLSLLGRINLIKMKVLPKFTYLFRHSPQWIPKSLFTQLNRMFSSFIWGPQFPRYRWTTLMRPTSQGGLACPDLYKYFLATDHGGVVAEPRCYQLRGATISGGPKIFTFLWPPCSL